MSSFWFLTVSNRPRVRHPTQVLEIISRYWFDFDWAVAIEQAPEGCHRLCIQGDDWPGAWKMPPDTQQEDYYPDFASSGQEDFSAFLIEVAPFLVEPLIVQAIGTATGEFPVCGCEWRVEPGASEVAKTEFTSPAEKTASLATASV